LTAACSSGHNSTITKLDLSNQKLTAIPDSVFSLEQLRYLDLGNSFTLYPPLSALGEKNGSGQSMNKITTIPTDIKRLKNLRALRLCFNDLRSLPKEIISLQYLDTLDISFNQHLNIVSELETLKKMQQLKYLNVMATNIDQASIEELRKALPKTKISTKLEDLLTDTTQ
jgi:Leucine-rich repeat (LRR) protein